MCKNTSPYLRQHEGAEISTSRPPPHTRLCSHTYSVGCDLVPVSSCGHPGPQRLSDGPGRQTMGGGSVSQGYLFTSQ